MKTIKQIANYLKSPLVVITTVVLVLVACQKNEPALIEDVRLFRPVLSVDLYAEGNTIVAEMGNLKAATGYIMEVSRDSFATVEYQLEVDTNIVRLDEELLGESLFWNMIYQVRATALSSNPAYNSKKSLLGSVRTETFPTILEEPTRYDILDVKARIKWQTLGSPVTGIKAFAADDLRLTTPLLEFNVSEAENNDGSSIIEGLDPETLYQIAIYSGNELRGWRNYQTRVADIAKTAAGVVDLTENEDPTSLQAAINAANDGDTILLKHGVRYDLPTDDLSKSITIRGAYGFGKQQAQLYSTSNMNFAAGATIDHLRFVNIEVRGSSIGGVYAINASRGPDTNVNEVSFEGCHLVNMRGVFRIKADGITVNNFIVNNSLVDSIGSYGVMTVDKSKAKVNNIALTNSTFNKTQYFLVSRNDSESLLIENCTLANISESGRQMFRWRQSGQNNITGGVTIRNSIFGHSWDMKNNGGIAVRGIDGLQETSFDISSSFSTSDFSWSSNPVPNFPVANISSTQDELWVDVDNNDFNFADLGFVGKSSAGDPQWRVKL
jgi:hypothetical protein